MVWICFFLIRCSLQEFPGFIETVQCKSKTKVSHIISRAYKWMIYNEQDKSTIDASEAEKELNFQRLLSSCPHFSTPDCPFVVQWPPKELYQNLPMLWQGGKESRYSWPSLINQIICINWAWVLFYSNPISNLMLQIISLFIVQILIYSQLILRT